jgi:alpha-tubulin suppressor-like RCC1 family protein
VVPAPSRDEIAMVSLGLQHTVCLTIDNNVWTCGAWINGILGHDSRTNVARLRKVRELWKMTREQHIHKRVLTVACGDR